MRTLDNVIRDIKRELNSQEELLPCEEVFREFVVRRSWLQGNGERHIINKEQYESLKRRDGNFWNSLTERQQDYLVGYAEGWVQTDSRRYKLLNNRVKPLDNPVRLVLDYLHRNEGNGNDNLLRNGNRQERR